MGAALAFFRASFFVGLVCGVVSCSASAETGFQIGAAGGQGTYTNVAHPELLGTTLTIPPDALAQTAADRGGKKNCEARPDNYLEPLARYQKFFFSLRPPAKLIVKGIWAQPSLDQGGKLIVAQSSGGTGTVTLGRRLRPPSLRCATWIIMRMRSMT